MYTLSESYNNPTDLINVALEELVRAGCELAAFSTLDRIVSQHETAGSGCCR